MRTYLHNRFGFLTLVILIFLAISTLTRTVLLVESLPMMESGWTPVIELYAVGALYDFIAVSYLAIPFVLYLLFIPKKLFTHPIHRYLSHVFMFVLLFAMTFYAFSEWFFWDEFNVRFNFIAVDYLVYTTEVIGNIRESYPMGIILTLIALISTFLWFILYRFHLLEWASHDHKSLKQRLPVASFFLFVPFISFGMINQDTFTVSNNQYNSELAKDGLYSLFSAFRNNTLNYDEFYLNETEERSLSHLSTLLSSQNIQTEVSPDKGIVKKVTHHGNESRHNVVMIVVESLSGEFLTPLGGTKNITPNLDKLAQESLFFTNFYATGTRTIRGMEAITLSTPPSPGRSIVKRPDNHEMFSSGFIFKEKGYETKFIYGGHGYFDNMNEFFSHNGFDIVDRTNFTEEEETFHTIWGVCDEDLLNKTLKEADNSYSKNRPFFSFVMTTSNHRPYDYPEGRIDIPSHSGRAGAVKYTDYAIGAFLKEASKKPWFNDTIFVVVADHCASSAGKTELPIHKYHIPLFIYAPQIVDAARIDKVASQIDIMPTLFSMLNWSYQSKFFGSDILSPDFTERALVGTYQKLGLYKEHILTVLSPVKKIKSYEVDQEDIVSSHYNEIDITESYKEDIIAYYQSASLLHEKRLDRYNNATETLN